MLSSSPSGEPVRPGWEHARLPLVVAPGSGGLIHTMLRFWISAAVCLLITILCFWHYNIGARKIGKTTLNANCYSCRDIAGYLLEARMLVRSTSLRRVNSH